MSHSKTITSQPLSSMRPSPWSLESFNVAEAVFLNPRSSEAFRKAVAFICENSKPRDSNVNQRREAFVVASTLRKEILIDALPPPTEIIEQIKQLHAVFGRIIQITKPGNNRTDYEKADQKLQTIIATCTPT